MSRHRGHLCADDIRVAVQAELHGLDLRGGAPHGALGQRTHPYDAPGPSRTLRSRRCTYPRRVHEAASRCSTCQRLYCVEHCRNVLVWAHDARRECDLCARQLSREAVAASSQPATLLAIGAMIGFLLIIGLGTAIDIAARAGGFIVLWVFAGAFFALLPYMDR